MTSTAIPSTLELHYASNIPAGNNPDGEETSLMASSPNMPVKSIKVWEDNSHGILGLSISWFNSDERSAGYCNGPVSKQFDFDKKERIQIMYVYAGERIDGFWFVTNQQKSFFPGKSSTRFDMVNLGNGVLVGFEGRVAADQMGFTSLGANFRKA